jgi:hypothetical protein
MQTIRASIIAGTLAVTGVLGIVILAFEQVLRGAPLQYYALMFFVAIDFVAAGFALAKPSKTALTVARGWAGLNLAVNSEPFPSAPFPVQLYSVCGLLVQSAELTVK